MTQAIWKFSLSFDKGSACQIEIPSDAKILTMQMQDGLPCIWAVVNLSAPLVKRTVTLVTTEERLESLPGIYVGTYQQGWFVGHIFISPFMESIDGKEENSN